MELPIGLVKQFVESTRTPGSAVKETTCYGTVVKEGSKTYVRLDGAGTLTPVSVAMEAEDGDRVTVMMKNHTAVITGNLTSPASARTSDRYMKLTDEGLVIGMLDENGNPTGTSLLLTPDTYYIVDGDGKVLGSFAATRIALGNASVALDGDVLLIQSERAIGLRNVSNNQNGKCWAEVVCTAGAKETAAALQAYGENGGVSSVIARLDGVAINVPEGKVASVNGSEIITTDTLIVSGTVKGTGLINGKSTITLRKTVDIPDGYYLAGIREISTDHNHACHITQFETNPTLNEVSVKFSNESESNLILTVRVEWFALRSKGSKYVADETVDLAGNSDD